ncbi:MAG: biotin/lipoyl-containing protein [Ginsengibacter sp.]
MKTRFRATINKKIPIDLTAADALPFQRVSAHHIHAIDGNEAVRAEISTTDFLKKKYSIRMNGAYYEVALMNDIELLIDELGLSANVASVSNELLAPMPGLIVEVLVKEGSKVHIGESLLVLEAMKMENSLTSPRDGIIKSVLVNISDAVDKGTVLIEFENDEENK